MNDVEAVRRCAGIAFRQAKAHEAASENPMSAEDREMSVHMSLAASAVGQALTAFANQVESAKNRGLIFDRAMTTMTAEVESRAVELVETMRTFEIDHGPDGWPAVRMREISALCDEVERLRALAEIRT